MKQMVGTGALFQEDAHQRFFRLTSSRYRGMMERLLKKKLILKGHPPFDLNTARAHVLAAMNGKEDGFVQCRFCHGYFALSDISADHEMPLSRGGSIGLDNIGYPCQNCNQAKGSLTPTEFLKLIHFLETEIPMGRKDVLGRLAKAVSLAAGNFATQGVIAELKERGDWQKAQDRRRQAKRDKATGLGKF